MPIDPNSQWYYTRDGNQIGPFTFARMHELAQSGQVSPGDLVWTDGMASWMPMHQVPAFQPGGYQGAFNGSSPGQAPPEVNRSYTPNYASGGYGAAGYRGPSQQGMAIAGFVLAFFFPLLGLIFSIIALNGMKKNQNNEGKGLATAGLVISIAFFALFCLWFSFAAIFIGLAASH